MIEKITAINLNDTVKVKLTKSGLMRYIEYMESFSAQMELPLYPKRDEKGFVQFQLWDLIGIFHGQINMYSESPFVNNEIIISEELIDEKQKVKD